MTTFVSIDHNFIHYLANTFPANYDAEQEHEAVEALVENEEVSLCLSMWNLVEPAMRRDIDYINRVSEIIEMLSPLWLAERLAIQKMELSHFVYTNYFNYENDQRPENIVFNELLSQSVCSLGVEFVRIGDTAQQFMEDLSENPRNIRILEQSFMATPDALNTLHEAQRQGGLTQEQQEQAWMEWLRLFMPERNPENDLLTTNEINEIIGEFVNQRYLICTTCPAIAIEDAFCEYRVIDPGRNPRLGDAPDLAHFVVSVAYCDIFLTNDGYLHEGANFIGGRLQTPHASLCRSYVEIVDYINAHQ